MAQSNKRKTLHKIMKFVSFDIYMSLGEKYKLLGQLCSIRTGQTFKQNFENYQLGNIAVFLPRDIAEGTINSDSLTKINEQKIPSLNKHLLQHGDIIIVNKGTRLNHFLYQGIPEQAVTTTAFYVITTGNQLLPQFLNWYLGQQEAKRYFMLNARGSIVPGISKSVLEQLPVPVIPSNKQEYIAKIAMTAQQERDLTNQWLKEKQAFTDSFLWEQINKDLNDQ